MNVATKMNKTPVLLHKEIYGFLVNRLLQATRQEALKLFDMGVASFEDIDTAAMNGLGYPMGPFSLLDPNRNRFSLSRWYGKIRSIWRPCRQTITHGCREIHQRRMG